MLTYRSMKLMACASTDKYRYNIRGIYVNGNQVAATDGHCLVIALKTSSDTISSGIYKVEPSKEAKKQGRDEWRDPENDYGKFGSMALKIDGEYPQYRKVIPDKVTHSYSLDVDLLVKVCKSICDKKNHVTLSFTDDPESPIVVTDSLDPDVIGFVMPLRIRESQLHGSPSMPELVNNRLDKFRE